MQYKFEDLKLFGYSRIIPFICLFVYFIYDVWVCKVGLPCCFQTNSLSFFLFNKNVSLCTNRKCQYVKRSYCMFLKTHNIKQLCPWWEILMSVNCKIFQLFDILLSRNTNITIGNAYFDVKKLQNIRTPSAKNKVDIGREFFYKLEVIINILSQRGPEDIKVIIKRLTKYNMISKFSNSSLIPNRLTSNQREKDGIPL